MTGRKPNAEQAVSVKVPLDAQSATVGYALISNVKQDAGLEAQRRDLLAAGCSTVFAEQSLSIGKRDQLAAALDYLREGGVLVVTKPDRLARSVADLLDIIATLDSKGVTLRILSMGMDTDTRTGKLMVATLGAMVEFEQALMLKCQRESIPKTKDEGQYKGRKSTARAKSTDVLRLREAGMTPTAIAAKLEISRASVYRIMVGGGVYGQDSVTPVPSRVDADKLRQYARQACVASGVASGVARRERSADYAADLAPVLAELDPDGSMTLGQLAEALTARKVPTMRGGPWSAVQVHRLKARIKGVAS